jgi:Ca2+-binding EF-hand superfamily protein
MGEFLKLIRLLREEETAAARDILETCEHIRGSTKSSLPEASLAKMLLHLGYCPPDKIIKEAMRECADTTGDGSVDIFGVLNILRLIREKQVAKLRANAGISDQQANKLKSKFGMRLEHGKHVELTEFDKVMCELFPAAKHQPGEKERIRHLIKEQTQGRGYIKELMEAFWIVRLYADMRDEDKWAREQDVAHDAGFTHWQVASFREAFVSADANADGCLSELEIQAVFENLMALNLNQFEAMSKEFHKMGTKSDCIEFCDFLRLMHVILQGRGLQ